VEITRLRVSDVLENGFLLISGKTNKTDRVRMIQVPEPFNEELQTYVAGLPADWYLFGENLKPGPTTKYRLVDRMTDKFRRYRKRLKLPATVTLYSLKDTGGERLIENGFNPKQIRDHMGHSDLAMTDKYIKKRAGQVDEKLLREFPRF
jgi:integrase